VIGWYRVWIIVSVRVMMTNRTKSLPPLPLLQDRPHEQKQHDAELMDDEKPKEEIVGTASDVDMSVD
jgi:hypothetical protein